MQTTDGTGLIIVRFNSYFPVLGIAALPVGVAAQLSDHAGHPTPSIAVQWVPCDEARPWRDLLDGALAYGVTNLAVLAEAWADGPANGITMDLSVQVVTLPPSVEAWPELTRAAVDLVYWQVLTEHCALQAEAEGLGLLTA